MEFLKVFSIFFTLLVLCLKTSYSFLDGISLGVAGGAILGYNFFKDQTYCRFSECCNERAVPGDIKGLKRKLEESVFGQHIVLQQLIPALEAHFNPKSISRKPLVISFHGTPGTGKNFVANLIAEALYTNGVKSRFVHKYMGRADFPSASNIDIYKARINYDVRTGIADCPRSLFIFDEVDKMPEGVFEPLTSLVDYNAWLDGQDNTKAIFIFLSNTAGPQISNELGSLLKKGQLREETKMSDFEQALQKVAYNVDGGFKKTSLIDAHVIDHYIPFLPLEKKHIVQCLQTEFRRWNKVADVNVIESIIKDTITYDKSHGLFAISGCKTLEKKVALEVASSNLQSLVDGR